MSNELSEREARIKLMDELYRHATELHNTCLDPILTLPKFAAVKSELKEIERRLMSIQSDIGMLAFNN